MLKKIVIFGQDNYNTLGMLRSLANRGYDILVVLVGGKHGVTSVSKYCTDYRFEKSTKTAVRYLIENYPVTDIPGQKAVLMPGGDSYSLACAENYEELSKRFHLMCTSDPNVLIRVTDKNAMGKEAQKAGILVPESQLYWAGCETITIPFPAILKHIVVEGRVEFKTKILKNIDELAKFKHLLNPNNTYLLQRFIPRDHDISIYGCRLTNGEVILAGYNSKYRWSDDGGGSFGYLNPELPSYIQRDALERFLSEVDYHGLFSAEYGYFDGKAYFYEVNFRNDGFTHLAFQAGANLPLLWVEHCFQQSRTASSAMTKQRVYINEIYDIANVFHGNVTYRQYKQDRANATAFIYYDLEDLKPYKNLLRKRIYEIPLRAFVKKFRPQIVWLLSKTSK